MQKALLCASILALTGCGSMPRNEGVPAKVSTVVERIKADLGVYQQYDAFAAAAKSRDNACHGAVGFYIESVKVSLTTQTDDTVAANASATLPVGSGTLGLNFGGSQQTKGTQTLTFNLYPKPIKVPKGPQSEPMPIDPNIYPIAANLQQLRNGLLEASQKMPCVSLIPLGTDGKPANDPGNTYAFGFTVINTVTGGAGLKFVTFSLGATGTSQRQAGNTITATFKARPDTSHAIVN